MKMFNECIAFDFNQYAMEKEKWNYTEKLKEIVSQKYIHGVEKDVCSCSFYEDEVGNWIFKYKAVPATAPTSSTYPFIHALVLKSMLVYNKSANS
jgi:hypothetical protein